MKIRIMSDVGDDNETANNLAINTFQITKTKLYVPVVTLNTDDKKKLSDLLSKRFKMSVFWKEYKSKIETYTADLKRILLGSSFQVVNRLFVLTYRNADGDGKIYMKIPRTYALPRVELTKFIALIDGLGFYDNPVSDKTTKYEELLKLTTVKDEDHPTGCLLDYKYYKDHYLIIACDLPKQKELDADPRIIQQLECILMLKRNAQDLTILEKFKETVLEFSKGTTSVLSTYKYG